MSRTASDPGAGLPVDAPAFDEEFRAELNALFRWRRDVRHFRTEALPAGLLDRLLAAIDTAPSVGLSQPWRFVTVDDPARRLAVRANFAGCNADALAAQEHDRAATYARLKLAGLERAPCQIAAFVDPDPDQGHGLGRRTMPDSIAFSAVIAIHTLWLAAHAEGVGLGWVSILDPTTMPNIVDVPQHWQFIAYLCLGYPETNATQPELEREGWEQRRRTVPICR